MAYDYIDTMAFSKAGLADQLVYEGFSPPSPTTPWTTSPSSGASRPSAWPRTTSDTMAFSCTGLIDQLVYEKFSRANATYGANHTSAC